MNLKTLASVLLLTASGAASVSAAEITSFPIGTTWPDSKGVHINCHGGCVVNYEGAYYWFGESRTGGHSDGISVYRSTDLYNWENLGMAVTHSGERDDVNLQDISEGRLLERPKVIYNAKTDKWVMWAHWENGENYNEGRVAILKADKITGPYEFVSTMRPNGHDSRDQTLFLDTDGNAYHFCSTNTNQDINVVRLSDDFLTPSPDETLIMKKARLEASTVCKVDEMYFATFSECNGWDPARGHAATALADPLGEWTECPNFCTDADDHISYRSQGAFVFSVKDLGYDPKCFIFYGDRWNKNNVGGSTYVWLPLSVRSGYPTVRNYATWSLDEVMTDMYRFKRADEIADGGEYRLLERRSDRFVSRVGRRSGFYIKNDDDRLNIDFIFAATPDPTVWKLRDASTGHFLASRNGKLTMTESAEGNDAKWRFVLQPDGYYYVINEEAKLCLTVKGNVRHDGTELVLGAYGLNDAQGFAPYFDSKKFPALKEAPMYTKAYYTELENKVKELDYKHDGPVTESLPFEAEKTYAVIHASSGLAMTLTDGSRITLSEFGKHPSQAIKFVPASADAAAAGYNITDGNGNYLYKEGDYSLRWGSEVDVNAATAVFTPENTSSRLLIRTADNRYLGTDGATEGAEVWSDKQGDGRPLSYWYFSDYNKEIVVTPEDEFLDVLENADITFGSINPDCIGTDPFDIDADAYDAFATAIDKAFSVTADFAAAKTELEAASATFEATKSVLPVENHKYVFRQKSGRFIGCMEDAEGPVLVAEPSENTYFTFVASEDGKAYGLLNSGNGKYLSNKPSSAWSMSWADDAANKRAQWTVEISKLGYKIIRNGNVKGYIGSDATDAGSDLYCNKAADALFSQWYIKSWEQAGICEGSVEGTTMTARAVAGSLVEIAGTGVADIINLAGMTVASVRVDGSTRTVSLPAGVYVVRLDGAGKTETVKLLVH